MNMKFLLLISSKNFFRMFELKQIMRQRESKVSAEMLNGLTDGKQTTEDINNFEEKTIANIFPNYPKHAPHLYSKCKSE